MGIHISITPIIQSFALFGSVLAFQWQLGSVFSCYLTSANVVINFCVLCAIIHTETLILLLLRLVFKDEANHMP